MIQNRNHAKNAIIKRLLSIIVPDKSSYAILCLCAAAGLSGCDRSPKANSTDSEASKNAHAADQTRDKIDVLEASGALWEYIKNDVDKSLTCATQMQQSIDTFLEENTQSHLVAAQNHWQECEHAMSSLPLFSHISDGTDKLDAAQKIWRRLIARPIQPGYLDKFGPYLYSGLVHDIGFALSPKSLIQQHMFSDNEEVVLGIYAIEYMLFAENRGREVSDYSAQTKLSAEHIERDLKSIEEIPNNRRRTLLKLQTQQLAEDLSALQSMHELLSRRWQQEKPRQQAIIVNTAVHTFLTSELVELASMRLNETAAKANPEPEQAEHADADPQKADKKEKVDSETSPSQTFNRIKRKLEAIRSTLKYYPKDKQEEMRATIDNMAAQLQGQPQENIGDNKEPDTLKSIHQQFKTLLMPGTPENNLN